MARPSQRDVQMLTQARKRFALAYSYFADTRENQRQDLKFYGGSPDNRWQWPDAVLRKRDGFGGQFDPEPCLTINVLPAHVHQVLNPMRMRRPKPMVTPSDSAASPKAAEMMTSVLRHIDYMSASDIVFDTACLGQVVSGEGFFRIVTEYVSETSFDQEPRLRAIRNPFSVYMDPMAQDPYGQDANWAFIETLMDKDDFYDRYPEASPYFGPDAGTGYSSIGGNTWIGENEVRVVEYFYVKKTSTKLHLFIGPDGGEVPIYQDNPSYKQLLQTGMEPVETRAVTRSEVYWCLTNGFEVLDKRLWPGSKIPIVRVPGNVIEVDGQLHFSGIVRNAKDAQRDLNYWRSQETATLALAPRAPFIGAGGQFEGYEDRWGTANKYPWPYLEYNPDVTDARGNPLPKPSREPPPQASSGFANAIAQAMRNIEMTTGQYAAALGAPSNDRTGRAVEAREIQSNTGTYQYAVNYRGAVLAASKQLVELIPKLITRARLMQIVGETGDVSNAQVNPAQADSYRETLDETGQVVDRIYNPAVGQYDVRVTTGPDYLTNRAESAEAMRELVQTNPGLWEVFGDLMVEGFDWPNAAKISERIKRKLDPKLLEAEANNIPPREAALMQQLEQMQQAAQQLEQMLMQQAEGMEARKLQIQEFDSETKRLKVMLDEIADNRAQAVANATADLALTQTVNGAV